MIKQPIALEEWRRRVQRVQDTIRPRGLSRTAEALRGMLSGELASEQAQTIQLLACAEVIRAGLDPATVWMLSAHVVGLMRDLAYLQVVDYCACHHGRRRFAADNGAEVGEPDPRICVACDDGIRKHAVEVEGIH